MRCKHVLYMYIYVDTSWYISLQEPMALGLQHKRPVHNVEYNQKPNGMCSLTFICQIPSWLYSLFSLKLYSLFSSWLSLSPLHGCTLFMPVLSSLHGCTLFFSWLYSLLFMAVLSPLKGCTLSSLLFMAVLSFLLWLMAVLSWWYSLLFKAVLSPLHGGTLSSLHGCTLSSSWLYSLFSSWLYSVYVCVCVRVCVFVYKVITLVSVMCVSGCNVSTCNLLFYQRHEFPLSNL